MSDCFSTPVRNRTNSRIDIPPSPFLKKLGWGTGVSVFLYERSPETDGSTRSPWAVKRLLKRCVVPPEVTTERLKLEADILKNVKHPNIIGFRGYTKDTQGLPCLIMENGERSLFDLIESRIENTQGAFPAKNIHEVAVSILSALDCLHNKHKLLHGDIKSANVLIAGGDFDSVKLCDFGVSLRLKDDLSGLKDPDDRYSGTSAWNCMETITNKPITDKADIYSFGLVLWEMLTLLVPHTSSLDFDCSISSTEESFVEDDIDCMIGTRPPLPDCSFSSDYQPLLELISICTDENPDMRPSARLGLQALQSIEIS